MESREKLRQRGERGVSLAALSLSTDYTLEEKLKKDTEYAPPFGYFIARGGPFHS